MDAGLVYHNNIFEFITNISATLLDDEQDETIYLPAGAPAPAIRRSLISKRRTQIYEYVLRNSSAAAVEDATFPALNQFPRCQKLLNMKRDEYELKLINNISLCLLEISKSLPTAQQILDKERKVCTKNHARKIRLLVPQPLRLLDPSKNTSVQEYEDSFLDFATTTLPSIRELKEQMQQWDWRQQFNSRLLDLNTMRQDGETNPKEGDFRDVNISKFIFKESYMRIHESLANKTPLKTHLPALPIRTESVSSRSSSSTLTNESVGKSEPGFPRLPSALRIPLTSKEEPKDIPKKKPNSFPPKRNEVPKDIRKKELFKFKPTSIHANRGNSRNPLSGRIVRYVKPNSKRDLMSNLNVSNYIKNYYEKNPKLKFITMGPFIEHIKKVSVGLESESFVCLNGEYRLRPNKTMRTLLPEVLEEYVQPFCAGGRNFKSLLSYTKCPFSRNNMENHISQTLRKTLITVLSSIRFFLASVSAVDLSSLFIKVNPTLKIIDELQRLSKLMNATVGKDQSGAAIVTFLWETINQCVDENLLKVLLILLRSICDTYFSQLKSWLYYGELKEPFNETFICPQSCKLERTKEFYDKGFQVRSDLIPGFLSGCDLEILQLGKYSRLLRTYLTDKRCDPERIHLWEDATVLHQRLFALEHPDLKVCLTDDKLSELEASTEQYYTKLVKHTKPFTMQSIFDERMDKEKRYGNCMVAATQAHIATWEARQRTLVLQSIAMKTQRNEELNQQQLMQEQVRLEQRRAEIATLLAYQQKCDELEEKRLLLEKQDLEQKILALRNGTGTSNSSPDDSSTSFVSCDEMEEVVTGQEDPAIPSVDDKNKTEQRDHHNNVMDLEHIRMRNMSSEQFQQCHSKVQLKNHTVPTPSSNSTEAQRNRQRVLNCTELVAQLPQTDVNMNPKDLTDMQRNRNRMLSHEMEFISDTQSTRAWPSSDSHKAQTHVNLNRNLQLPLDQYTLGVDPPVDAITPMSTTSDIDIDLAHNPKLNLADDAANNNVNGNDKKNEDLLGQPETTSDPVRDAAPSEAYTDKVKSAQNSGSVSKKSLDPHRKLFMIKEDEARTLKSVEVTNPFSVKRNLQQSVMVPLRMHLSIMRNEVLRIYHELDIYEHFCQLRNYFFLMDGEFGSLLVDGILMHIEKGMEPISLCQTEMLDAILGNAIENRLRSSSTVAALFAEKLNLNYSHIPQSFDLMDIDLMSIFTLEYKAEWPLNLVISDETISKYSQIFSHLRKLRHVSFVLERSYQYMIHLGKNHGKALQMSQQYRHLQIIRHKMLNFLTTLQNYLDNNALRATWKEFNSKLLSVESMEELYQRHAEYLKQVAFLSMLNRKSAKFRETVDNMLLIILRFCKILKSKDFVMDENVQEYIHPRYKRLSFEETEFEKFLHYMIYLGNKIDAYGYQDKMVELIGVINYNRFYKI